MDTNRRPVSDRSMTFELGTLRTRTTKTVDLRVPPYTKESPLTLEKKWPHQATALRSSTPPHLSESNKELMEAFELEEVYKRIAENHKFHFDIVREWTDDDDESLLVDDLVVHDELVRRRGSTQ
ncbi:hypothetical protein BJY52DRAFT_1187716 [Lactarius psammicola]|nr:hypothetical protein BJY52DRAFT_1187716 [Lactarius psammicola]